MFELLEAEWGVAEINGHIERQRLLIEQLGYEDYDTTSARTVFDSLLVSPPCTCKSGIAFALC